MVKNIFIHKHFAPTFCLQQPHLVIFQKANSSIKILKTPTKTKITKWGKNHHNFFFNATKTHHHIWIGVPFIEFIALKVTAMQYQFKQNINHSGTHIYQIKLSKTRTRMHDLQQQGIQNYMNLQAGLSNPRIPASEICKKETSFCSS